MAQIKTEYAFAINVCTLESLLAHQSEKVILVLKLLFDHLVFHEDLTRHVQVLFREHVTFERAVVRLRHLVALEFKFGALVRSEMGGVVSSFIASCWLVGRISKYDMVISVLAIFKEFRILATDIYVYICGR